MIHNVSKIHCGGRWPFLIQTSYLDREGDRNEDVWSSVGLQAAPSSYQVLCRPSALHHRLVVPDH